jgi:hypothetical protein
VFTRDSASSCAPVVHNLSTRRSAAGKLRVAARGRSQLAGQPTMIGRALDGEPRRWDPDLMTEAAKKLLEEFNALQEGDRAEVLAELLRRVALAPHDLPNPEDLVSAADKIFIELDRREQSQ